MFGTLSRLKTSTTAVWILLLAGYVNLWLGVVSSIHQTYLLRSDPTAWTIVCTQFGLRHTPLPGDSGDGTGAPHVVSCPICTLASLPAPPSAGVPTVVFRQAIVVFRETFTDPSLLPALPPVLRPPTRGPPHLS